LTLKGQTRDPIRLEPNITKTVEDRDSVPKEQQ